MNKSDEDFIVMRLKGIFKNRFEMDLDKCDDEALGKNLLGNEFGMKPRDLIYLFFDIEKEFNITIPQEDIAEGRFNSFNNMIGIIRNQLMAKSKEANAEAV